MTEQENIKQTRERHTAEIRALEDGCSHSKLSKWMDWAWAPGHFSGRVRVCEHCGKVIQRDGKAGPLVQHTMDSPPKFTIRGYE